MAYMRLAVICTFLFMTAFTAWGASPELVDINLPAPRVKGGKPIMEALGDRQSTRDFSAKKLSPQVLSDLLWAAFGINRADSGKRTAPSTRNWQETDLYVILEEGIYLYQPAENRLKSIVKGDQRKLAGSQSFAATAPLNLVYVSDTSKMGEVSQDDKMLYAGADTGFISQNVYLFCASEGLGTVVRAFVNRPDLAAALKLPKHKIITLAQTVGYPSRPLNR